MRASARDSNLAARHTRLFAPELHAPVTMYLKMKKCDIAVTRKRVEADKVDLDEKDLQAINYIYSAISNKQMELISDKETSSIL